MNDNDQQEFLYIESEDNEEESTTASWVITYGDMMTLLLTFFVLLFAMSDPRMDEFEQVVESLKTSIGKEQIPEAGTREGLTMLDKKGKKKPNPLDELGAMVQKEIQNITSEIDEFIMKNKLGGQVKVEQDGRGAIITISDVLLFPPGKTKINDGGDEILMKIKDVLNQFNYHIKVEGHTDSIPIHNEIFPSNWELSANRASKIVRFFIENGVPAELLSAEGFAEYRPIAPNDTPAGRAQNRRVEIVYERGNIVKEMLKIVIPDKVVQQLDASSG